MISSDMMFPKSARLRSDADFQNVKRNGIRVRAGCVMVSVVPGNEKRLGVIVSRRVGNAVQRNRLKRVTREFFRKRRSLFPGGDCVVIYSSGAAKNENVQLRLELKAAVEKLSRTIELKMRGIKE